MAVLKCLNCGKLIIGDTRQSAEKGCRFCGGQVRTEERTPTPVTNPVPAVLSLAPKTDVIQPSAEATVPADLEDSADERASPRRRGRRRRKGKSAGPGELPGLLAPGTVRTLLFLAFLFGWMGMWLLLLVLSLFVKPQVPGLLVCGGAAFLVGGFWLYGEMLEDEAVPEMPWNVRGAGLAGVVAVLTSLVIKSTIVFFFGAMYGIANPQVAWKPISLILLGLLIIGSGIVMHLIPPLSFDSL